MEFKYSEELVRYENCPPSDAVCCAREAFRFVHEAITDTRNFLPTAKLKPRRVFPAHVRCDSLALSFFSTREKAVAFYARLKKGNKLIHKTIGTHLAVGNLAEEDGRVSAERRDGHFSLFESKAAALQKKFKIDGAL